MDEPDPYQVWNVRVTFRADRGGDAWGMRQLDIAFAELVPGTPEHEALMVLWRKASADALASARATGVQLGLT
jgi:hypothetical protein